jgi:predicted TIM-barrel fold metal-dependent hydrolase
MKRNFFATLSLGALSVLFTATGAYAQRAVEATVPFAFNVGATQMPAGTYRITVDPLRSSVTIRNYNNSAIILAHALREYPGEKNQKLVFRHANDRYFLAEIWGEQGSEGMKLRAPKPVTRVEEAKQRWPSGDEVLIALK